MKCQKLPALTSLRFFAAAAIVLEHSLPYFHIGTALAGKYVLIQGVTFFFVLSGFILTHTYSHISGVSDAFGFIYGRVAKIWPAHIITMLAFYAVFVAGIGIAYDPSMEIWASNAFLFQAWDPRPSGFFAFNSVSWTLSVELLFYALFPLLIANFDRTWRVKLGAAALLALYAISLANNTGAKPFDGQDSASIASWVYIWPPAHLIEFVLGMVAGHMWKRYGKQVAGEWTPTHSEIIGVMLILTGSVKMPQFGWWLEGAGYIGEPARTWISVSGSAPFYAAALFLLARGNGYIGRALSVWPLVKLGEISFATYLVHQMIVRVLQLKPSMIWWPTDWTMEAQFALYWLVSIAASALLWFIAERCITRWMKSAVSTQRTVSPTAGAAI